MSRKTLRDLGLSMSQLNFVTSFIARHGSVFEVIGVHPRVIQLVCNLHASSWVTYGSLESAIHCEGRRKAGMCLRERGFQHTVCVGSHGIERRVDQQRCRDAHSRRQHHQ